MKVSCRTWTLSQARLSRVTTCQVPCKDSQCLPAAMQIVALKGLPWQSDGKAVAGDLCSRPRAWGMQNPKPSGRASYVICRAQCKMRMQGLLFKKQEKHSFCICLSLSLSWYFLVCYLIACSLWHRIIVDAHGCLGLRLPPGREAGGQKSVLGRQGCSRRNAHG